MGGRTGPASFVSGSAGQVARTTNTIRNLQFCYNRETERWVQKTEKALKKLMKRCTQNTNLFIYSIVEK
jgi:hypothetical protein